MNKASFQLACLALLTASASGCASSWNLFAKKPQSFEEFKAQRGGKPGSVAGNQVATSPPSSIAELLSKGHTAFQQGNLPEAQAHYWAVLRLQSNHPVANHRLGVIADRQQDYATAQRHYMTALQSSPRDPNLLNDIGYSFLLQSRYAEAEQYLLAALQQNPTQSNAINNLGLLYARLGQPERALAMFRRTSSDAEAQAKLARLMPNGAAGSNVPPQMLAQQSWPAAGGSAWNANAYQPGGVPESAAGWPPTNLANAPAGFSPQATTPDWNSPSSPVIPPPGLNGFDARLADPHSGVTPAGASVATSGRNDAHVSETTRKLKEQMEQERLRAQAERTARDNAERQRREALARQMRQETLGPAMNTPPSAPQSSGSVSQSTGSWPQSSTTIPPGGTITQGPPIYVGASSTANPVGSPLPANSWPMNPPPTAFPGDTPPLNTGNAWPNGASNSMSRTTAANPHGSSSSPSSPASGWGSLPASSGTFHAPPEQSPGPEIANGTRSPLDAMPSWPPPGSSLATQPPASSNPATGWPANSGVTNNASEFAGNPIIEAERAASRWGMSAGPGSLFPITPGPSVTPASASNKTQQPSNAANRPQPGATPVVPDSWPLRPQQNQELPMFGQPPAGSFGPGGFGTSSNSSSQLPESAAQFALQERLPPSEQYVTPKPFGNAAAANGLSAQPAVYSQNRANMPGTPGQTQSSSSFPTPDPQQQLRYLEQIGTRSTVPDRFGGDDRWEQGALSNTFHPYASAPTFQGQLSLPTQEHSLNATELMIQQHNAETNRIRALIDAERQLPGSELYFRSRTVPQTGTPTGPDPRPQ
jgi:Flp pilus assembly protein TadD